MPISYFFGLKNSSLTNQLLCDILPEQQNMKPYRQFGKYFQIRYEPLGLPECPYLYRLTLIFFGFSIRLHHWLRSDDRRFFHDHACNFISIVLKGHYKNVTPNKTYEVKAPSCWYAKAEQQHYLDIPKGGAWTLLLCGRPRQKWGFFVNGRKLRPLQYFHKYGVIQTADYQ